MTLPFVRNILASPGINCKFMQLNNYTGTREVPDKLIIRNSLGQAVMVIPVRGNRDFKTIDVREWTSGLYFYSLMGKDQTLESGKFEILK